MSGNWKRCKARKEIYIMPMDRVKLRIDKIAYMERALMIQPCIYAESLANPDLQAIIIYCNEHYLSLSSITNVKRKRFKKWKTRRIVCGECQCRFIEKDSVQISSQGDF